MGDTHTNIALGVFSFEMLGASSFVAVMVLNYKWEDNCCCAAFRCTDFTSTNVTKGL